MEGTGYPTGEEEAEEEATNLQKERNSDGRHRQGTQPMTAEEHLREEEERRRGEPMARGRGAIGEDMGRKRAQTAPTSPSISRSAATRKGATTSEDPIPEEQRAPTNVAAEKQESTPTPWRL
jgi:hypothetical protein